MLNLLHIHLNDTSDQVTVDVEYMQDHQGIQDFKEFKVDYTGQILRYKILVRDQGVYRVLYNSGTGVIDEVPF